MPGAGTGITAATPEQRLAMQVSSMQAHSFVRAMAWTGEMPEMPSQVHHTMEPRCDSELCAP